MEKVKTILLIVIGNIILAFATACFVLPANIVVGGTTGLGLLGQYFFNLPVAKTVLIANIFLFILGLMMLGKRFALTTLVSTFIYPFILEFFQNITMLQNLSNDILLSTIVSGALSGIGIGLVIKTGASTGGMDIPPLILNKFFGLNVSAMMYLCDTIIILMLILLYSPIQAIYGIVYTVIMSYAINQILILGNNNMQMLIISDKYDEIREILIKHLDCGVSLFHMEKGVTKVDTKAILCVVTPRRLTEVKKTIQEIDPNAFITISRTSEVRGKGFTLEREYIKVN